MELFEGAPKVASVQVGVYLCGGNTFVAHHLLNGPQVCTPLYQVRGKGMAQGVRCRGFLNSALLKCSFESFLHPTFIHGLRLWRRPAMWNLGREDPNRVAMCYPKAA